jgi:hypothetical protein
VARRGDATVRWLDEEIRALVYMQMTTPTITITTSVRHLQRKKVPAWAFDAPSDCKRVASQRPPRLHHFWALPRLGVMTIMDWHWWSRLRVCPSSILLLGLCLPGCNTPITSPTAPSPTPPAGTRLEAACATTSLLIGQQTSCAALIRSESGQSQDVTYTATWSVNPTEIADIDGSARLTARQVGGTANVVVASGGKTASIPIVVKAEDGLRLSSVLAGSDGGSTRSISFSGYYAVASSESGALGVEIRNNEGRVTSFTRRQVRGGGSFLEHHALAIPSDGTEACAFVVLRIGNGKVEEPQGSSDLNCFRR